MKLVKAKEMSLLDQKTISELGIPSLVLMENAARGVLGAVEKYYPQAKRVLIVAGKGNNGGDGIALARMLYLKGLEVDLYLPLGEPKGDAKKQLEIVRKLGLKPLLEESDYGAYELIVDALFGTGFSPPVRGKARQVIESINLSSVPVVAVDIPSGLSADSGRAVEPFIRADITVTFQFPKLCHFLYPASKYCGKVLVQDISIPGYFAQDIKRELLLIDSLQLREREPDTYKNREGHILLVGGSTGKTGAVVLSAMASTRTGSGLVSVGVPEGLNPTVESLLIEEMTLPLKGIDRLSYFCVDEILEQKDRFSALGVGMGMGRYEEGQDIVVSLLERWDKPLLLDADALNNLADSGELDLLKRRKAPTVLTPHVGEFSRLSGIASDDIVASQTDVAQEFATEYGCYLVLKGARTVIATPEGYAFLSARGTPAMAKGGVGDVLAGMLTSLLGKVGDVEEALKLGVFLHGLAGEVAHKRTHTESLRARDIIDAIPMAYTAIEKKLKSNDTNIRDDRQGQS